MVLSYQPLSLITQCHNSIRLESAQFDHVGVLFNFILCHRHRDLFQDEEFVAAGALATSEHSLHGLDGKKYRGRHDNIKYDDRLTQALQVYHS